MKSENTLNETSTSTTSTSTSTYLGKFKLLFKTITESATALSETNRKFFYYYNIIMFCAIVILGSIAIAKYLDYNTVPKIITGDLRTSNMVNKSTSIDPTGNVDNMISTAKSTSTSTSSTPIFTDVPKKDNLFYYDKGTLISFMEVQNYKLFSELSSIIIDGIYMAAKDYNIPPIILFSLAAVESNFDYSAVSKTGSIGLFQISKVWMDPTWENSLVSKNIVKHKRELYSPIKNIRCGAYIIKHYMDIAKSKKIENTYQYALTKYLCC